MGFPSFLQKTSVIIWTALLWCASEYALAKTLSPQECAQQLKSLAKPVTIAIYDPISSGGLLSRRFQERGANVIHVATNDKVLAQIRSKFPNVLTLTVPHPERENDFLRFLNRSRVQLVLPGAESGVIAAEATASALDLPSNDEHFRARKFKTDMHSYVFEHGLRIAKQFEATTPQEVFSWLERHGGWDAFGHRIVIKPRSSQGGEDVFYCSSNKEIEEALASIVGKKNRSGLFNKTAIVQEYLDGPEFAINGASTTIDGHVHHGLTDVWEYFKDRKGKHPLYGYENLLDFAEVDPSWIEYTYGVLDAIGIRLGAWHVELIVTKKGPVLVEAGARLYGSECPRLTEAATTYGQLEATVDAYLNPGRLVANTMGGYTKTQFAKTLNINSPSQQMRFSENGWQRLRKSLSNIEHGAIQLIYVEAFYKDGETILPTEHLGATVAQLDLTSKSPTALDKARILVQKAQTENWIWAPLN